MPRSCYYHLILSPPVEHRETVISSTFFSALNKRLDKHTVAFASAFEKGSNLEFTHIDVYAEFIKPQDKTDLVKKLCSLSTDCDWKDPHFFTVRNIKTSPHNDMIGYTMKEQNLDDDDSIFKLKNITRELVEEKVMVYTKKHELKESQKKHRPIGIQKLIMAISTEICLWEQGKNGEKWQFHDSAFTDIIILIELKGNFINLTKTQKENIRSYFRRYYANDEYLKMIPNEIHTEYTADSEYIHSLPITAPESTFCYLSDSDTET